MGIYQGAGADFEVRMELARRAISIGYTREAASRLMEEAYWVEDSRPDGTYCQHGHPGCSTFGYSTYGCEACEVVRQSDAAGFVNGAEPSAPVASEFEATLRELITLAPVKPVKVKAPKAPRVKSIHFVESAKVKSACGNADEGDPDPGKTTCAPCQRTRRFKSAHAAMLIERAKARFAADLIEPGMLVRHRVNGCLGVVRTIEQRASMGWWMGSAHLEQMRGAEQSVFATPEDMLAVVELITIHDLIKVGSMVKDGDGALLTVTDVGDYGVGMRTLGATPEGLYHSVSDFAADVSRGYLTVMPDAPVSDPIIDMIAQAKRDRMAVFCAGQMILTRESGRLILARIVLNDGDHVTYTRVGGGVGDATVTWEIFEFRLSKGMVVATGAGMVDGEVIKVSMVRQPAHASRYAESAEVFQITGPGVWSRHSDHVITQHAGVCCDEERIHMHLSAQATVIALHPIGPAPVRHEVAMGDVIVVDGRPHRIAARRHADPILLPIQFEKWA